MSVSDFFAMGGYAVYVWPAFGVAAAVLIGLAVASHRRLRVRQAELMRIETAPAHKD